MFKKLFLYISLVFTTLLLNSCGSYDFDNLPAEADYFSLTDAPTSVNYYDIYHKNNMNCPRLNSIGNQKILVLPIHIDGTSAMKQNLPTDNQFISNLETIFFGDSDSTYWHSVSSFYKISSYNKLAISGVVAPIYDANTSYKNVPNSYADTSGVNGVVRIARAAIANYKKVTGDDCKQFDSDNDGFIDAVWLIYDVNNSSNYDYPSGGNLNENTNPYWAYTTNYVLGYGDVNSPTLNNFSWASFDFMFEHSTSTLDAHTYIHETGHLLGLDDYYDYEAKCSPMAWIDMMDWNVGDHNAFSKYALGWVTPKLVNSNITVNLKSFTESGECIILKPENFNNSAFCEYFMIMYVTPTGLNYEDYVNGYYSYTSGSSKKKLQVYNKAGVMILHVTSYFGSLSGNSFIPSTNPTKMLSQWVDNTSSGTDESKKVNFLSVIDAGYSSQSSSIYSENFFANNDILFRDSSRFNLLSGSKYRNLMASVSNEMNDGTMFKYNVNVNLLKTGSCNISIFAL